MKTGPAVHWGSEYVRKGWEKNPQPCHFRVIFALYNFMQKEPCYLSKWSGFFFFLFFFKQRSSLPVVKSVFPPKSYFSPPFLWSAVSQNIGEVCTEVTGEGCIRGSGLDYLETWGGALHRGVSCKGVSWCSRGDPPGREETNAPHPIP